jgi:hypothetical protein
MKMIGHEAVSDNVHRKLVTVFFEQAQEVEVIFFFKENFLTISAAMVDVVIFTGLEFLIPIWHNGLPSENKYRPDGGLGISFYLNFAHIKAKPRFSYSS